MTNEQILKYGEIQYLRGRLDELHKSIPNVLDLHESRVLDQRIEKYLHKLRKVDEVAYNLYQVELKTRMHAKERSKKEIKELLGDVLTSGNLSEELVERIKNQINKY
jgi:hypothetical protein